MEALEEEMAAATRSRSMPGGVEPPPTRTAVRGKGPTTRGPADENCKYLSMAMTRSMMTRIWEEAYGQEVRQVPIDVNEIWKENMICGNVRCQDKLLRGDVRHLTKYSTSTLPRL